MPNYQLGVSDFDLGPLEGDSSEGLIRRLSVFSYAGDEHLTLIQNTGRCITD